jgi:transcriptional regulator with XRE-family HTH domain
MELQNQIKKYRTTMKLSQEELAEKVFVSRQTVSNWENGKSYPDIHSLLLLSSLFEISLDELIKGDIELMKKEIHKNDTNLYNNYSNIFSIIFIGCLILFVPAVKYLKVFGLIMWLLVYAIGFVFALKINKIQKEYDISTFKEIIAFSDGKLLDELEKQTENKKKPYSTILKLLFGAILGTVITAIMLYLLGGF